jgi:peroxiredoxin
MTGLGMVAAQVSHADAPPPAPSTAKTQVAVDPAAHAILNKSLETYKSLKAFSATLTGDRVSGTIAWEKPSKFHYDLTLKGSKGKDYHTAAASDGKIYSRLLLIDQKHYYQSTAGASTVTDGLSDAYVFATQGAPTLTSPPMVLEGYAHIGNPKEPVKDVTIALDAPNTADGVPVDVVKISQIVKSDSNTYEITKTISIGHNDHLIRKLVSDIHQTAPLNAKHPVDNHGVEDYTKVQTPASLPETALAFSPPAGVTLGTPAELAAVEEDARTYHDKRLVVGVQPFAFQAADLDGQPVNLDQYKGKVLVLDFWATWCGPCRAELPNVIANYRKFHKDGLEIVGVSLDESKSDLTDFLKENKIPYRIVFDGKGWENSVAQQYKVRAIPFALVVGRNGKIAAVDVRGPELTSAIKKALAD